LALATLQARQQNNEPFLRQYLGIQCSGFKMLVSPMVHALWPVRERRCNARLAAEPHANIIGPPQCPVIAIFTLRRIGEPITVAAQEVDPSSMELNHPPTAGNPVDDARTDEIRPGATEPARPPDDPSWLFDILPFLTVPLDPIRQDKPISVVP
jgi:hypothetical protein